MLYTIAVILVVMWLLGMVSSYTMGGFVHLLLVVAIIVVLLRVIQGRKAYHKEAEEVLRRCRDDGTTGERYVVSFIEGVMKRDRHRG